MKTKITTVAAFSFFLFTLSSYSQTVQKNNNPPSQTGYAPVNGLKMYYEIYGEGMPLVLIHGGVGAIEMFGSNIQELAASHKVIAVDLQAHGRTADIDRPLSYELLADDIASLLKYLKIGKADVMGYSVGGGVTLQMGIRHPDLVHKLVVVSAPFKHDGWYPEIQAGMAQTGAAAEALKQTPLYQMYSQLAPKPADWALMLAKLSTMLAKDYDWSLDVKKIKVPVMIVVGDADAVRTSHAVEFFALFGGGQKDAGWDGSGRSNAQLAILPGLTHYNIFMSPVLAQTAIPFLDSKN